MKVLNLNRENTEIMFSREELLTLKNSLLEVDQQLTDYDFKALIRGISKEDLIKVKNLIQNTLNHSQKNGDSLPQSKLISFIEINKEGLVVKLPYESILGLSNVLNVLDGNVCLDKTKYITTEAMDKAKISSLLHSINSDVVRKMEEKIPRFIIHRKSKKIVKELDLDCKKIATISSEQRIKKRCTLQSTNYQFSFLLVSIKNKQVANGIQISLREILNRKITAKSEPELIDNSNLIRLISYLELFIESINQDLESQNTDLFGYILSISSSKLKPLFDIKLDLDYEKYPSKKVLCIYFKLYVKEQFFEIEDSINISEINSFIQLVKDFLSELLENNVSSG